MATKFRTEWAITRPV